MSELRTLYTRRKQRPFFDALAVQPDAAVIEIDSFSARLPQLRRENVMSGFRKLDELGLGRFFAGRRGFRTRFQTSTRLSDVGRAAQGRTTHIDTIDFDEDCTSDSAAVRSADRNNGLTLFIDPRALRRPAKMKLLEMIEVMSNDGKAPKEIE